MLTTLLPTSVVLTMSDGGSAVKFFERGGVGSPDLPVDNRADSRLMSTGYVRQATDDFDAALLSSRKNRRSPLS